ncbi:A-kinase anchor protein 13 isoform X4 [Python bivittatus]|uniref:A-kinase anchor protein 13 isoform X4 n=1 Tax=Python bivittatus TaxID=176946 RepID=A0A9F5J2W7_PYTBI|nr:A-kinase anchor protein 13 isoform X4 [Python bivittatus]
MTSWSSRQPLYSKEIFTHVLTRHDPAKLLSPATFGQMLPPAFWVMKLNPQQGPLYGDCIITVLLTEDDQVESDDVIFYLVFTGSAIQHCTSTRKLDSGTLETIAPGHDCCETVKVSLCATKQGHPLLVVAEDSFQFVQDEAYDAAQFLVSCAGNQQALNFTRFLDRSRPPAGDLDFLDEKVTLAFRHLKLPTEWNVLGADHSLSENVPRETLLHFAARLGLLRLTWFLLKQPGGRRAVRVPNSEGATPVSLALERGYQKLHQILTKEEANEPDSWSTLSHTVLSVDFCIKHHQGLNVYTLTVKTKEGAKLNMEKDILQFQMHIQKLQHMNVNEHHCPAQTCEDINLGSGPEGLEAAAEHGLDVLVAEATQKGSSDPLDLDAVQVSPPGHLVEEGSSQQLKELLDASPEMLGLEEMQNQRTSCQGKILPHKEEGEGSSSAVDVGAVLEENDSRGTFRDAAGLPSCGNTSKEAGMSSSNVSLEQGSLCEGNNFFQEPQLAESRAAENNTPSPASCEGSNVSMGQGECKSCTGAMDVSVTAQQCMENGETDVEPSGTTAMEASHTNPAASFLGDGDTAVVCKDENEPTSVQQGHGDVIVNAEVSSVDSGSSKETGAENPTDSEAKNNFTKLSEMKEKENIAPNPGIELVAINLADTSGFSPEHPPVMEGNDPGQLRDADMATEKSALDVSSKGLSTSPDGNMENPRASQTCVQSQDVCGGADIPETPAIVQSEQKVIDSTPLETEATCCSSEGNANPTMLGPGSLAACQDDKQYFGKEQEFSCSVLPADPVDVPESHPNVLNSLMLPSATEKSLCGPAEMIGSKEELDQSGESFQKCIALTSALLVEKAIREAQLMVTQEDSARGAPVGQEASSQLEGLALPLCGEGTQCIQEHLMGTPSAAHNQDSKQNQEVGTATIAEAAAAAAAEELLTGVAEQGSPVQGEPAATSLALVDGWEEHKAHSSSQLPESEQELLGKKEALPESFTPGVLVQSRPCDLGREHPVDGSNAETGLKEKASSLETDEQVKVDAVRNVSPEPGLAKGASLCNRGAPPPEIMLNPGLELGPAGQAASPAGGTLDVMEAPLMALELSMEASLSQHREEEEEGELENVPSRISLQPIAEEPLCDGDLGPEMPLLASKTDVMKLEESEKGNRKASQAEPESPPLPPCPFPVIEQLDKAGTKDSAQEPDRLLDNADPKPSQVMLLAEVRVPSESLAGSPMEVPSLAEATSESGCLLNGEEELNLQPGSKADSATLELTSSSPTADPLEMKTEEEMDVLTVLAENVASEGMINRESWCPVEPSPDSLLLEQKQPCNSAESDNFLEDRLSGDGASSQGILKRGSGSESELFPFSRDGLDEVDFRKQPEEEQSVGHSTSSTSSVDDTISLERNSSIGSNLSVPRTPGLLGPQERYSPDGSCFNMAASGEDQDGMAAVSGELDELLDSVTEVSPPSGLRNSLRPLSPFRRHSWGPGKNSSNSEAEINHRSSVRLLGEVVRKAPSHRRSYSLEGLSGEADGTTKPSSSLDVASMNTKDLRQSPLANDERGSLVSLTEEEQESELGEMRSQILQRPQPHAFSFCTTPVSPPLTKSMSLMTIAQVGSDNSTRAFSSNLTQSISEESGSFPPPSPSRKDLEPKSGTKVSRTFSYLKNKMSSSKKSKEKEKDKEKLKERDRDSKERDKDKMLNGHLFSAIPTVGPITCYHCLKPFNKDSFACANCSTIVHKSCKESVAACAKVKMKLQKTPGGLQPHDTSSLPTVIMRSKSAQPKERPRSAILAPDEVTTTSVFNSRRSQQNLALSKSVSIQNIAGVGNDESVLHTWKFLSQSTDSLNKISRVNESMESLTDEGADMNEGQLMGDFETDLKQLEAQSWSQVVDSKFLKQQKKDIVKRQDVIYELMQTEMHHVRTLKIMSDVYSRGMVQELQYEQQMVEKIFPCLDNLLNIHSQFFQRILERKKESLADRSEKNFVIKRIGDILVNQFSGENAERMKKTYGKFCGHHNEAVNYFKDLHSKEKRFQAFIKKKMSCSVVRRLGIPECILLVTQRITKYPVLLQRILQYTKENDTEHQDLVLSLNLVKEVITAVDSKVSNYEKKMRLNEIYTRTDNKSIMRMKSGQMFAREDLRRRKFVRDGPVSLKNVAGRLKEVLAVLLSDVLIFLQEKDQKYVFASLDQKSTVISLKKLIVREVAHEEKGLFLISMGGKDPEMVEVHASSKEERNSWIQIIQDTINTMDKEEDEGIPSESEEEKRVLDTKARELKEQLHQKDQQIIALLEEKEKIFRDMTDCSGHEEGLGARMLFRANTDEAPKGESIMKNVISEVEQLQGLVSRSLGSALGQQMSSLVSEQEGVGPISLPRRAETFGGFDSHQMNVYKGGEKDEGEEVQDLRRTESDSVLKKGGTANLMFVLKRNNEQVLQSLTQLHSLLSLLQAVVVQQDTYIEDQKLLLTERTLSRSSFRPNSLIEQEKQRSLEKQRQELANLQKQQALHQEERRKKEKDWEAREKELTEREAQLAQREEQIQKGHHSLEKEREELQQKKATYQLDLEHLRTAQKQLEKEKEQLKREMEQISQPQMESNLRLHPNQHTKMSRTPSLLPTEDLSSRQLCSSLPKQGHLDTELSASPKRNSLSRTHKEKTSFHLIGTTTSGQTNKPAEGHGQMPNRLFGLAKPKEKKEKKKKSKGHRSQPSDAHSPEAAPESEEIFC